MNDYQKYRAYKLLYIGGSQLKKKNNQLENLLIENLQNYQYYVLNNFFINRNYKKNLKEAILTDKILNKIANEKTSY